MHQSIRRPIEEIDALNILHEATQMELLRDQYTLSDLVATLMERQDGMARLVSGNDAYLDGQVDVLGSLNSIGLRTSAALETRLNRLAAKDVSDPEERVRVRERRLQQPEALVYLAKASEDVQFIRDFSQTILAGFDNIEHEIRKMAAEASDLLIAIKGCALHLEGQHMEAPSLAEHCGPRAALD